MARMGKRLVILLVVLPWVVGGVAWAGHDPTHMPTCFELGAQVKVNSPPTPVISVPRGGGYLLWVDVTVPECQIGFNLVNLIFAKDGRILGSHGSGYFIAPLAFPFFLQDAPPGGLEMWFLWPTLPEEGGFMSLTILSPE